MADASHRRKRCSGASSKNKGSSFERKICRLVSLWITGGKRDDVVWRTAGSGGRATARARKNCPTANAAGDMCATDPVAQPFIDCHLVEMKKGYSNGIDILKMIDAPGSSRAGLLAQWWLKARKEARFAERKHVWIIFERNRSRTVLMLSERSLRRLEEREGRGEYPHPEIRADLAWGSGFSFVVLEQFLQWTSMESLLG